MSQWSLSAPASYSRRTNEPRAAKGRAAIILYHGFSIVLSLLYGYVLASLPGDNLKDRSNYLVYAAFSGTLQERYLQAGWRSFIFNEPAWLAINDLLGQFLAPAEVVWTIIFASASILALVVLVRGPKDFLARLLLLVVPLIIKNYIIHLRQGVAITVFMVALSVNRRSLRWALMALTPLIHSSFFFIVILYILSAVLVRIFKQVFPQVLVLTIVSVPAALAISAVAEWSGARQAESYDFTAADISGLGFLLWAAVFILMVTAGPSFVRSNLFSAGVLAFYLSCYFWVEIGGRILESGLVAVCLSALRLQSGRKLAFFLILLFLTIFTYASRWNQPWLGWGVEA